MSRRVSDLLQMCIAAHLGGADFPTAWNEILKTNPLVSGFPVQGENNEDGPVLEVPLVTGQRLIFGSDGFSIA